MIKISFADTNLDKTVKDFSKLDLKLKKPEVPLKRASLYMLKSIDQNFRSEGRPKGWISLKPATIAHRRKQGSGAKILQDTARLKGSIIYGIEGTKATVMPSPQKTYSKSKSNKTTYDIGAIHQFGAPKANIPARPFLLFQEQDQENIIKIFKDYVNVLEELY